INDPVQVIAALAQLLEVTIRRRLYGWLRCIRLQRTVGRLLAFRHYGCFGRWLFDLARIRSACLRALKSFRQRIVCHRYLRDTKSPPRTYNKFGIYVFWGEREVLTWLRSESLSALADCCSIFCWWA